MGITTSEAALYRLKSEMPVEGDGGGVIHRPIGGTEEFFSGRTRPETTKPKVEALLNTQDN